MTPSQTGRISNANGDCFSSRALLRRASRVQAEEAERIFYLLCSKIMLLQMTSFSLEEGIFLEPLDYETTDPCIYNCSTRDGPCLTLQGQEDRYLTTATAFPATTMHISIDECILRGGEEIIASNYHVLVPIRYTPNAADSIVSHLSQNFTYPFDQRDN